MAQAPDGGPKLNVLTVAQLTELVKQRLETDPRLVRVAVVGELSNFKHHSSGHMYFTLKDDQSRVRGVMFASRNRFLRFLPKDGMRVICTGTIGVFERDGQYQLYVDDIQPDGVGALYAAYQQLRERLAAQGLFDPVRKRPLPAYPRRIGVVTSATGAVIRDICTTLSRRYPLVEVVLAPAAVQGPGASESIVRALALMERLHHAGQTVDVVIVGRGGGSLEELWAFNEEAVARAVFQCPIPVISAVGHETDTTICDFVADVRAPTPTAAAELASPNMEDLLLQLADWSDRAHKGVAWAIGRRRERLLTLANQPVLRDPMRLLDRRKQTLDFLDSRLQQLIQSPVQSAGRELGRLLERLARVDLPRRMEQARTRISVAEERARAAARRSVERADRGMEQHRLRLEALNPLGVLSRGYSVVFDAQGSVVSSTQGLSAGQDIRIQMSDGQVKARVVEGGDARDGGSEQLRLDV